MSSDLEVMKVSDVADVQTGPFGSQLHKEDYAQSGTPIITVEHLVDNKIIHENTPFVSDEDAERLSKYSLMEGDIVFSRVGSVDSRAYVSKKEDGWLFSGRCLRVRINNRGKIDPKYLSYYFGLERLKEHVRSIAVGATMPSLNTKIMSNLEFKAPKLAIQTEISSILSSLDNKIELNNAINKNLEEMAQALFKHWLVDFDFPNENGEPYKFSGGKMSTTQEVGGEEIPVDWEVKQLGELVDSVSQTYKFGDNKVVFLNTSDILAGDVLNEQHVDPSTLPGQAKKSIAKGDILYSEIRPANKRFAYIDFDAKDYVVSTKLMVLRVKSSVDPIVIYFYLTSKPVIDFLQALAESRSGTFPQITFQQLKSLSMAMPPEHILDKFTGMLQSLYKQTQHIREKNKLLSQIRDTLLPKLMSGEIRVPVEQM